jgi:hypothetical protein
MRLLLRVLVIFLLITSVLSFIRRLFAPNVPAQRPTAASTGHLVKDPICGMYIPQDTAIRARDQFFCSETCRRKFLGA